MQRLIKFFLISYLSLGTYEATFAAEVPDRIWKTRANFKIENCTTGEIGWRDNEVKSLREAFEMSKKDFDEGGLDKEGNYALVRLGLVFEKESSYSYRAALDPINILFSSGISGEKWKANEAKIRSKLSSENKIKLDAMLHIDTIPPSFGKEKREGADEYLKSFLPASHHEQEPLADFFDSEQAIIRALKLNIFSIRSSLDSMIKNEDKGSKAILVINILSYRSTCSLKHQTFGYNLRKKWGCTETLAYLIKKKSSWLGNDIWNYLKTKWDINSIRDKLVITAASVVHDTEGGASEREQKEMRSQLQTIYSMYRPIPNPFTNYVATLHHRIPYDEEGKITTAIPAPPIEEEVEEGEEIEEDTEETGGVSPSKTSVAKDQPKEDEDKHNDKEVSSAYAASTEETDDIPPSEINVAKGQPKEDEDNHNDKEVSSAYSASTEETDDIPPSETNVAKGQPKIEKRLEKKLNLPKVVLKIKRIKRIKGRKKSRYVPQVVQKCY